MTVLSGCSGNPQKTPASSAAPRSGSVWVADEGRDSLSVIDASGNWAWVTNSYDNTVTAVDLSTLTAMAPIPVGTQPSGISHSPHTPTATPANVGTLDIPTPSAPPNQTSQPDPHSGHQ